MCSLVYDEAAKTVVKLKQPSRTGKFRSFLDM
jgi:hypothetical protein